MLQYSCFIVGTACNLVSPSFSSPGPGAGNVSFPGWTHRVSPDVVTFGQSLLLGGRGRAGNMQHQARSGNNKGPNDKRTFNCQWPERPPVWCRSRGPSDSVRGRKPKLRVIQAQGFGFFRCPPPPRCCAKGVEKLSSKVMGGADLGTEVSLKDN